MELDKIITDLVEKRLDEFLSEAVADEFSSQGRNSVRGYIEKRIAAIIETRKSEIDALINSAITAVTKGTTVPKLEFTISMNVHS